MPAAAGLVAGRPLLGLLSALAFAGALAGLALHGGLPLPPAEAAGLGGSLELLAGGLSALLYAGSTAWALVAERRA